jgi:hypothetical protein
MRSRIILSGALAVVLSVFVSSAAAQTKTKKKKPAPKPRTVAVITPSGDAQVVSRADDFPADDQQDGTLTTAQPNTTPGPETVEERIDRTNKRVKDMGARIKSLESSKPSSSEEKKKGLLLNLDILTRAEQRSESLRKQLFEMVEKENSIKLKLDQIENDIRPEAIQRQVAMAGTLRPEELRDTRRKNLEAEKKNMTDLLTQIQATKTNLESSVQRADLMVEKLRAKLEKDIDDALLDDPKTDN